MAVLEPGPDAHGGPTGTGATRMVLVVDDEEETREMLEMLLERAGFVVRTACNGADALALLASVRPDLIVLDLQMPVVDGYEFRQTQRRNGELIRIPTIVLTGTDYEPMLDPAIAGTLRKPVTAARLIDAIEAAIIGGHNRT